MHNITITDGQSVKTVYGFIAYAQLPVCCELRMLSSGLSLEILLNHVIAELEAAQMTQEVHIVSPTGTKRAFYFQ